MENTEITNNWNIAEGFTSQLNPAKSGKEYWVAGKVCWINWKYKIYQIDKIWVCWWCKSRSQVVKELPLWIQANSCICEWTCPTQQYLIYWWIIFCWLFLILMVYWLSYYISKIIRNARNNKSE